MIANILIIIGTFITSFIISVLILQTLDYKNWFDVGLISAVGITLITTGLLIK